MKHDWYIDEDGEVDMFRLEVDPTVNDFRGHNGPQCSRCQEFFCVWCDPGWRDLECPVTPS